MKARLYPLSAAAHAAPISASTLRNWFDPTDGEFRSYVDQPATAGGTRLISLRTVYCLAVTAAFTRLGLTLPRAATGGRAFAYTPDVEARVRALKRKPAEVVPGTSVATLIIVPSGDAPARIIAITTDTKPLDIIPAFGHTAAAVLYANDLCNGVAERLSEWERENG